MIRGRSYADQAELRCPACRTDFTATIWLVVDAQERPDLAEAIRSGAIEKHACPACGQAGTITAPLLYHDGASKRLILAVPLSVSTPQAAEELAIDLHGLFLDTLEPDLVNLPEYLHGIDLVAELDGLRAVIEKQVTPLRAAIEALVAAPGPQAFASAFAAHRSTLMEPGAIEALEQLREQLREQGEAAMAGELATHIATLRRFKEGLAERRQAMTTLLQHLEMTPDEQAIAGTVEAMLHAVEPQGVYRERLSLAAADQALADTMIDRLAASVDDAKRHDLAEFFTAIKQLRER